MRVVSGQFLNQQVAEGLATNYPKNRDEIFFVWALIKENPDEKTFTLCSYGPAKLSLDFERWEFNR